MDYITKKDLYDVIGKPLKDSSRTIFMITTLIIIFIVVIVFLLLTGYIKFSDPISDGVRQTTGTA